MQVRIKNEYLTRKDFLRGLRALQIHELIIVLNETKRELVCCGIPPYQIKF